MDDEDHKKTERMGLRINTGTWQPKAINRRTMIDEAMDMESCKDFLQKFNLCRLNFKFCGKSTCIWKMEDYANQKKIMETRNQN